MRERLETANLPRGKVRITHRTTGSHQRWRRSGKEREGRDGGREQRWISLNNLEAVLDPSGEQLYCAHTCTRGNMLSILLFLAACLAQPCAPITQPGAGNVWSPRRWEHYMAHNTIDYNLSAPACAVCTQKCLLFPVNVFAQARPACARAGKGAVYEIVYLESVVGCRGACTAGAVAMREKYKTAGEHYRCVSFLKLLPSGRSISHIWACNSCKQ